MSIIFNTLKTPEGGYKIIHNIFGYPIYILYLYPHYILKRNIMKEYIIFNGSPNQIINLKNYFFGILLIPLFGLGLICIIAVFLNTFFTRYIITSERLYVMTGVFSKTTYVTELYRVQDIKMYQPFSLRLANCVNIVVKSSDKTTPIINLQGIPDGNAILNSLRDCVEHRRDIKGVRIADLE
jgi:membrane protein YdbS with pleckstrin-like domain